MLLVNDVVNARRDVSQSNTHVGLKDQSGSGLKSWRKTQPHKGRYIATPWVLFSNLTPEYFQWYFTEMGSQSAVTSMSSSKSLDGWVAGSFSLMFSVKGFLYRDKKLLAPKENNSNFFDIFERLHCNMGFDGPNENPAFSLLERHLCVRTCHRFLKGHGISIVLAFF